jgi:hypothetical protein
MFYAAASGAGSFGTLQHEVDAQQEQAPQELTPLDAPVSGIAIASPREMTWRSAKSSSSFVLRSNELRSNVRVASVDMFILSLS